MKAKDSNSTHRVLQPEGWPRPKGYANGIAAKGTTVFLSGQIGWDEKGVFAPSFAGQVRQALDNIVRLLAEAETTPQAVMRLTWFVTDLAAYSDNLKEIGKVYRDIFGAHYPAMTLVQVLRLVEPEALVEIEATAVIAD
jgi:enamine deaminase RidA (YjgF/YER057c/UK114 family)